MPALPELTLFLLAGRLLVSVYATAATILATACLTLHALTIVDKMAARRRRSTSNTASGPARRSLFVRLNPEPASE